MLVMLWIALSSAADPGATWQVSARANAYGLLGAESALGRLGLSVGDVTIVAARYEPGIAAPLRSAMERRSHSWDHTIGMRRLHVSRERGTDGEVLQQADATMPTESVEALCASTPATADRRPMTVQIYDDVAKRRVGPGDVMRHRNRVALFMAEGDDGPVALTELHTGESITVVELVDPIAGQAVRLTRVRREGTGFSVIDRAETQEICVEGAGATP